jgi:hypothetical protein
MKGHSELPKAARAAAVQRVLDGETPGVVAEELGVKLRYLNKWVRFERYALGLPKHSYLPRLYQRLGGTSDRKRAAIRMVKRGKPAAEVASELAIPVAQLEEWVTTSITRSTGSASNTARLIKELKRENAALKSIINVITSDPTSTNRQAISALLGKKAAGSK